MKMKALIVNTSGIKTLFVRLENTYFFERGGESLGVGGELEAGGGGLGIVIIIVRDFRIELFVFFQLKTGKYCLRRHLGLK